MKIAIDVDDVLAAFTPHSHSYYGKKLEKCDYWCQNTMSGIYGRDDWFTGQIQGDENFWNTLPVLSKPEDITFDFDCYMTAMPEEKKGLRVNWLKEHGFPDKPVVVTYDKLGACLSMDINWLIDDKPETVRLINNFGQDYLKAIHFITPYAGFEPVGDRVITNLSQAKDIIYDYSN